MDLKTIDDLVALKASGIKEGEKWEFKSIWPSTLNVEKTICAFANTSGGTLLIGVNYDDSGNQIVEFPGIDKVRGLEERAVDIGGNINPRVIPSTWLIDVAAGKTVQVIQVLKSRIIPHMASNYIYYQRVDKENAPIPESIVERLYLARQVQRKEAESFLKEREYFKLPGEPHWLSICFCPLYLEDNLISHTRSNLNVMNSLRDIIDPQITDIFFRTMPHGYTFEFPHPRAIGKAIWNYLVQVLNNGVMVSGMWISEQEPYWETIKSQFEKMISIYGTLQTKFRYPGWTRIILVLTSMRNTKMIFPISRMNHASRPMIEGDLVIPIDFDDSKIDASHPEKVIDPFYTKIKAYYGLDEYIA